MKKTGIIIASVLVIGCAAMYIMWRRKVSNSFDFESVDWLNGTAQVIVDGKNMVLAKGQAIIGKNGYTLEYGETFLNDANGVKVPALLIKKDGSLYKTLIKNSTATL